MSRATEDTGSGAAEQADADETAAADAGATRSRGGFTGRAKRILSAPDPAAWLVGAVAVVLGVLFLAVDLAYNHGELVAPLDDVYIHLQYAAQLGEGHPYQYNTGDPISTGASSLLYTLLLGAVYALGAGSALLPVAMLLGVLFLAGTAMLIYWLGRELIGSTVGIWAGVLVAASGPLLWGAVSGMEVGLAALLVSGTLAAFVRERPGERFMWTPVIGALLALVRPEGLIFAVVLCGAMLWVLRAGKRASGNAGQSGGKRSWLPDVLRILLPVYAGVAQFAFYLVATGTASANGVQAKSLFGDEPEFFLGDVVNRAVANLRAIVDELMGLRGQDFAFPTALLLCVAGLAYLVVIRPRWRSLGVAVSVGLVLVFGAVSTLNTAVVHHMRYIHPFIPVVLLFAVCGVYAVTRVAVSARVRRIALHTLLVVALLLSLLALPTWAVRFGRDAATIADTNVSVGRWIDRHLPPDAVVAVKDVGATAYFGNREVVDLIGLATNGLATPSNHGTGALYEAVRKLPPEQRPDYFAVYNPEPGPEMQPLVESGVLESPPVISFPVHVPPDLLGNSIVPFDEVNVYRADWSQAGSGEAAPAARGELRDYLNVGALDSERAHDYRPETPVPGVQPDTTVREQGDVVDSGRSIVGGESFTAHDLRPGEPLTIGARTRWQPWSTQSVRVLVNGEDVGSWNHQAADRWNESTFRIPGKHITSSTVTVELAPQTPGMSPYPRYTSFGYWFFQ